jgi:hypothetical protein
MESARNDASSLFLSEINQAGVCGSLKAELAGRAGAVAQLRLQAEGESVREAA